MLTESLKQFIEAARRRSDFPGFLPRVVCHDISARPRWSISPCICAADAIGKAIARKVTFEFNRLPPAPRNLDAFLTDNSTQSF